MRLLGAVHHPERTLRCVAAVLLLAGLSACGYSLRGSEVHALPFSPLILECNFKSAWQVCQNVQNRLERQGVLLDDNSAPWRLVVHTPKSRQRVLTIAGDASTEEYELTQSLAYALYSTQPRERVLHNELKLSRIYRHQASALVAKERERHSLTRSMHQQLIEIMFRELAEAPLASQQISP